MGLWGDISEYRRRSNENLDCVSGLCCQVGACIMKTGWGQELSPGGHHSVGGLRMKWTRRCGLRSAYH